jgi:hypothetical protein
MKKYEVNLECGSVDVNVEAENEKEAVEAAIDAVMENPCDYLDIYAGSTMHIVTELPDEEK